VGTSNGYNYAFPIERKSQVTSQPLDTDKQSMDNEYKTVVTLSEFVDSNCTGQPKWRNHDTLFSLKHCVREEVSVEH